MKKAIVEISLAAAIACCALSARADAMHESEAVSLFSADRLEMHAGEGKPLLYWEAQAWRGGDLDRAWLRSRGTSGDGHVRDGEVQLAYRRAFSAYWDFSAGWRGELRPRPQRHWLALGLHGLAPWFVDVDADLYLGESGRSVLRVDARHDILFTQRLVLQPALEFEAHGRDDEERTIGAGLASLEAGLRLRYELSRKFAPYAGVLWTKRYGRSARFTRAAGEDTEEGFVVAGISAWF